MSNVSGGVYDSSGTWVPTLANLGVTDAPMPRERLSTALKFFAERMPSLPAKERFGFLKGIDLHHPVREVVLRPPQLVAAFRLSNESAFKTFYTKVGHSLHRLGLNPADRGFVRFEVIGSVIALESRCTSMRDYQSASLRGPMFAGGATQYIIPHAGPAILKRVP
jgi:hypothetical protein